VSRATDFSIVTGGPLYQLLLRARLLTPPLRLLGRRIVGLPMLAWLPLLVLTALASRARGDATPFLLDLGTHARFLVAIPLLLAAEVIAHEHLRPLVRQFIDRDLVAAEDRPRFDIIFESAVRLRNSVIVEVLLVAVVYTVGVWITTTRPPLLHSWASSHAGTGVRWSAAGYWYLLVSQPLLQFLLMRWYFRLFVWYRFLWQVSRLPLRLNPLHPDRAAGLGFLGETPVAFVPVLLAHTIVLAAGIGNQIWHLGARLVEFKLEILGIVLFLLLLVVAPLAFFSLAIARERRRALREYGTVGADYVNDFRGKWIRGKPGAEALLGTSDIQSLADLANSFAVVEATRLLPVTRDMLVKLTIVLVAPLLPLLLTVIPLDQIVDRLLALVL